MPENGETRQIHCQSKRLPRTPSDGRIQAGGGHVQLPSKRGREADRRPVALQVLRRGQAAVRVGTVRVKRSSPPSPLRQRPELSFRAFPVIPSEAEESNAPPSNPYAMHPEPAEGERATSPKPTRSTPIRRGGFANRPPSVSRPQPVKTTAPTLIPRPQPSFRRKPESSPLSLDGRGSRVRVSPFAETPPSNYSKASSRESNRPAIQPVCRAP